MAIWTCRCGVRRRGILPTGAACLLLAALAMAAEPVGLPAEPSFWKRVETLPPTPQGEGYLPGIPSGQYLQFRFAVPTPRPLAYRVNLDTIVALTGKGTAYQVEIHADASAGPLLYQGARCTDGFAFNAEDLSRLDAAALITPKHVEQGFIDLFVTAWVEGDTWTTYRDHDGSERDLFALVPEPDALARWQRRQQERAELARRGIFILPQPQSVELQTADFALVAGVTVTTAGAVDPELTRTAQQLAATLSAGAGLSVPVTPEVGMNQIRLTLLTANDAAPPAKIGPQGYVLDVRADGVNLQAMTPQGLFYAAQTLGQLLGREGTHPVLRGVRIADWPDLPQRMVQYDIARGNTVNVEYWKHWIRELSRLKINQIMLYMEDDYHFAKYPFLGRPDTFTAAKAAELVAFARDHYVELVPQIESLGHADALLSHPELQDLRLAGNTGAICPSAERTGPVLDDLFGELATAFPQSRLFHVGGDEVWGFAADARCSALVQERGEEGVYAFHLNALQALLAKRDRTMAFWGDEVLAFPKVLDTLTRDAVVFDWHYGDQSAYPSLQFFQEHGFKRIYACPAVHGFFDVYPQYGLAFRNIAGFTRAAVERQIEGVCCTTWGMNRGGNAENYLYGLAYAAQCAWNSQETDRPAFAERFAAAWLGLAAAGTAGEDMDRAFWFAWQEADQAPFWQQLFEVSRLFFGDSTEAIAKRDTVALQRLAEQATVLGKRCDEADAAIGRLRAASTRNHMTLNALQHAVSIHRQVAKKILAMQGLSQRYRTAYAAQPRQTAAMAAALAEALADLQALQAREPTLAAGFEEGIRERGGDPEDLKLFRTMQERGRAYVETLALAQAELAAGKTAPDPAALGLGWRLEARVGQWRTADINPSDPAHPRRLIFDVTDHLQAAGTYEVEWSYSDGEDGLDILSTCLIRAPTPDAASADQEVLSVDEHAAFTGGVQRANRYRLIVKEAPGRPERRLFIVGQVYNQRTFNTAGNVWLRQGWEDESAQP